MNYIDINFWIAIGVVGVITVLMIVTFWCIALSEKKK